MIFKSKIYWTQTKEMSEKEKEIQQAKMEVLGDDYEFDEEIEFENTEKNVIIDTSDNIMYVELNEEEICISELLGGDYIMQENGDITKMKDMVYIKSTLKEIWEKLNK